MTQLLKAGDWSTLATYYDLADGNIDLDSLISGANLASADPPGSDARIVQPVRPFELGARYLSTRQLADDEVEVTVIIEGAEPEDDDQPKTDTFHLKAHPEGYKLILKNL